MPIETTQPDVLQLSNVSVRFGRVAAINDASFVVPNGSITGLIGQNGAGKSTLIRTVAGLIQPDAGQIKVFGQHVYASLSDMLSHTGFLLSDPALFAYLTPRETLLFLSEVYNIPPAEVAGRVDNLLAFFEMGDAADRLVNDFSTGMQKRVAIAAALIHSPKFLVLDEPFEALDPLIVRQLKKLLVEYAGNGGTVLLSSHLLDAVDEICDRLVILDQGQVMIAGSTEDAKATNSDNLGRASLEELYASVVSGGANVALPWLTTTT